MQKFRRETRRTSFFAQKIDKSIECHFDLTALSLPPFFPLNAQPANPRFPAKT